MNRMPEPHGRAEVKHQLRESRLSLLLERLAPTIRRPSLDESHEMSDALLTKAELVGKEEQGSLPFLTVKNTIEVYPDTGESGDAYDVEHSLTAHW